MDLETSEPTLQPGIGERAIDTATDVSRTITDVTDALRAAVNQLTAAVKAAQEPGMPLSTARSITRQAPLTALCIAFMAGVAIARR
jgi:hypothetical protein